MRTSKAGTCNRGFTLLELIIVVFIVSLGLAIALPSFSLRQDAELRSEAGRLAATLRYLNDSALSARETYEMNFNFKEKRLRYRGPEGDREDRIDLLRHMTLPSKGKVSDGDVTVRFGPLGTGENFTILLAGSASSIEINFNALSGRVKLLEREGI